MAHHISHKFDIVVISLNSMHEILSFIFLGSVIKKEKKKAHHLLGQLIMKLTFTNMSALPLWLLSQKLK
jgi:hypothetical protein